MDIDPINPLNLTLDEVIKLNKFRNQEAQKESSGDIKSRVSGLSNGHVKEELTTSIQDNLRNNSASENRSIFDRLGWKKPGGVRTPAQQQALRAIRNAQHFKNRSNVRVVKNFSHGMPPPLTANVLRRHNQVHGNFTVQRRTGPGSLRSLSSNAMRPAFYRHSLKDTLDPRIQQVIRNLINDDKPATVTNSQGQIIKVDFLNLQHFIADSDFTSLPTNVRFALND